MKTIAATLQVSRSNLIEQCRKEPPPSPAKKARDMDIDILERIRRITDERSTYGYPRVTAVLRKELKNEGKSPVNHKRVYRLMKENNLCLTRYNGKRTLNHDGRVTTLKSNLRWCTDIFNILCWNGDLVRVLFSLDCCDREVMRFYATAAGIDGSRVRDLMTETVESRFGRVTTVPHRVEWLSDNGPQFTAHETVKFGRSLGLEICTTPAYSPESNGMAESFVKTFKRDYIYVNKIETAQIVLEQISAWFEDYNENAPHKGLKMMSPREYRRENLAG
jgi:transposase InsO family protein